LPVGFVDDNSAKQGTIIHGLKVLGKIGDIPKISQKEEIKILIIAIASASSQTIRRAVEQGRAAGLRKIKIIPPISEIINGEAKIGLADLRDVQMEDLLDREPVFLDQQLIENFIKDKKILVTGAAGSIGSELCRQIVKFNPNSLLVLDQDETGVFDIFNELKSLNPKLNFVPVVADIIDKEKIKNIFVSFKPQVVFHAAAYKHVGLMEEHPDEAVKNNIFGTDNLTEIFLNEVKPDSGDKKFIFISTYKAVNPSSLMVATKRFGEMICQVRNKESKTVDGGLTKFISVRFGNVLGSRGSVIPIFQEKIKKREAIEITHAEMKRYFMTIPEACLLVLESGAMGSGGEVFVLDMGDPKKIFDLANDLVRLSGLRPDIDIPIVYSEPKKGEKLFEELLTAEEGTEAQKTKRFSSLNLTKAKKKKWNLPG
jgi:FlaA1/EpsC-like NDP-sugar epimerase